MKWKFWLGIAVSVVCLYFVFRNIDIEKVLATLHSVNYWYLGVAMLLQLFNVMLRAERWKYLLAPIKTLTFRHLIAATMIGFMANNVLPARAGEFIRAYVIGKKEQISTTSSFATIILERVCDMITMLGFLLIILLFIQFPEGSENSFISPMLLKKAGGISSLLVFGLIAFLICLKEFPDQTTRLLQRLLQPFPHAISHKILEILNSFRMGLQVLRTGRHLVFLALWSLSIWIVAALASWTILQSFTLNLPLISGVFLTVITAFSVAVPSSPGYVGPFHAAVSAGVLFFLPDLDISAAAGIAIIFHLVSIIPITLVGLYYLWRENLSFAEIRHIEETSEEAEAADATGLVG